MAGVGTKCRFIDTRNETYLKVAGEVKSILGDKYNAAVFKSYASQFEGDINSLNKEYILEKWGYAPQEKISQVTNSTETPVVTIHQGDWSREEVSSPENQDKLFIFTDNTDRTSGRKQISDDSKYAQKYGKGKRYPEFQTSAVIRGLDNAMPISTQRYYHGEFKGKNGRWKNEDIDELRNVIKQEIDDIIEEWNTGKYTTIVLPNGGILAESKITGLNDKERSEIRVALEKELKRLYDAVGFDYSSEAAVMEQPEDKRKAESRKQEIRDRKQRERNAAKWGTNAPAGQGLEVSAAGDEFGRQFSALDAVLAEGSKLTLKRDNKTFTFDVGGYSIEAAYQLVKGYEGNPKGSLLGKNGASVKIKGENLPPMSTVLKYTMLRPSASARAAAEDEAYNRAYLPLWKLWKDQNKEKFEELRKRAKGKILTDKYAKTRVSQARALAELLYGTPKENVSEKVRERQEVLRDNAIKATRAINRVVKTTKGSLGIRVMPIKEGTHKQIANLINNVNSKGQSTVKNDYILAFSLPSKLMDDTMTMFINPFENETNPQKAVNKFIQWIIPDDYDSLPNELRRYQAKRDIIRSYLAKGGYRKQTIITDDSEKNILYARTLRYVIDNFQELRQRYNPVDISDFGMKNHNIKVTYAASDPENRTMVFIPNETYLKEGMTDYNTIKIEQGTDKAENMFSVSFPADYAGMYSDVQKERLVRTLAMAIPEGRIAVLDSPIVDKAILKAFNKMTERGFTKTEDTEVVMDDGSTETVGTFRRNGFINQRVVTWEKPYTIADVESIAEPGHMYIVETAESGNHKTLKITDNMITIPLLHDRDMTKYSYWDDSQFDTFKTYVDKAMKKAKEYIDKGGKVVLPRKFMGEGTASLRHYAPKCYEYLNQQVEALREYGNREYYTNQYLASSVTTVKTVETSPSESVAVDPTVLQGPKARLRQVFRDIEIHDLSNFIADSFLDVTKNLNLQQRKDLREKVDTAQNDDDKSIYQAKLDRVSDPKRGLTNTIKEIGVQAIRDIVREQRMNDAAEMFDDDENISQKYKDASEENMFNILFRYAIPLIESKSGIRVTETLITTEEEANEREDNAAEDADGDNSPEMIWTYNHRLVDPYKSLTRKMREMLSGIKMRDPNNLEEFQLDSIGQYKYWDPKYIYYSIMSRMAKMTLGEVDNFVVMTPYEQLSEEDKREYPIGKPAFPVLEGMREQYPWADDLIMELTNHYSTLDTSYGRHNLRARGITSREVADNPVTIAEIGNLVSQFYSNFCNHFVPYCTMVDGKILTENFPSGSVSLKNATITNYQGNVRFPGVDMIYNTDASVDSDAVEKVEDNIRLIRESIRSDTKIGREFWNEVGRLQKNYDSFVERFTAASKGIKDISHSVSENLKACGMVFSDFDIFCIIAGKNRHGITELLSELEMCMNAIKGLPDNEHIFESSFVIDLQDEKNRKFQNPRYYWNKFFEKFGDFVTEREYENNARILNKSRYSYVRPSYMSTVLLNLTSDIESRRKYIRENFMKYEWFYDSSYLNIPETDENIEEIAKGFRNVILAEAYKGTWSTGSMMTIGRAKLDETFGIGHDLLCKKDGFREKEYSQWTPEDIYQIMFKELTQPQNTDAGCFLIPVLSDSRVCKAIQMKKLSVGGSIEVMTDVVMQELMRMELVEKRNIILTMQQIQDKKDSSKSVSSAEDRFYNANKELFDKYREKHSEKLQNTENFDKYGSKFCFFPELNSYTLSIGKAAGDEFTTGIIKVLSKDPENPSTNEVKLEKVLNILRNMSDTAFREKAAAVGLTVFHTWNEKNEVPTREEALRRVISDAIRAMMDKKVQDLFWEWKPSQYNNYKGKVNETLLEGIIRSDGELLKEYYSVNIGESKEKELTKEQKKALDDFYNKLFTKTRDFYYNHTAMMSQFLELMVTDIAYYKDPTKFEGSVDFGKRFKEVYGAGMKLNTNSKFGKKIERNIILKDRVRRSTSYNVLDGVLQRAVNEGRILDIEKDALLDKMKDIKGTDAQAFRSLTSFRDIMDMVGRYSEEMARSMENLKNGTWTMNDFYTVYNTLKPFTYGPEDQDSGIDDIRMRTMVQHKNSEAILLAIYDTLVGNKRDDKNYSERLSGINMAMENILLKDENGNVMTYVNGDEMKAIDVVQYQSAVKVGAHGLVDINYSRNKLDLVHDAVRETGKMPLDNDELGSKLQELFKRDGFNAETASYYSIERKVGKLLDNNDITFEEYEEVLDYFEPTAEEVFEIIRSSVYKNGDESLGYDDQVLHKIPYAYYCIQQPTDDHYTDVEDGTFGSQPRHIIMADIPEDFEIEIGGRKYNKAQLKQRYDGLTVANLIDAYEREIEPLFGDSTKKSKKSAVRRLRERLLPIIETNPKYGKQMKEALDIVIDKNGNETFALSPNNISITQQLEEIITSMFKDAIHRQKINGGNVILAADIGYSDKLKIEGEKDADGNWTKINGVQCFLPAHMKKMYKKYLKEMEGAKGKYWILDIEKLKEDGNDKLIGYRIPTEKLYSIMPLIVKGFLPQQSGSSIVVAQDIIKITGSDNDADKLYLMMKVLNKDLKPVSTPKGKELHPLEMSKEQRDNEIIDIFYGITTHPSMIYLWANPGNYDNITTNAKRLKIMKNPTLRETFIDLAGIRDTQDNEITKRNLIEILTKEMSENEYNALYRKLMRVPDNEEVKGKNLQSVLVDFTNQYAPPLSPVYPDTFVSMHQTYMAGVAEKGIFANNTLDHAKLQWANIRIMPSHTFMFNGTVIDRLDPITVKVKKNGKYYNHYISEDCAEGSAASVDNGKDPELDDLNSTTNTASFFGFIMRLGIGIEGASLLLAQPAVNRSIRTSGLLNYRGTIEADMKKIASKVKNLQLNIEDDMFNWRLHNFTNDELYMNILGGNLSNLRTKGGDAVTVERLASLYRTYDLILNLKAMYDEMKDARDAVHYDSPNHAADTTIGGVIEQTKVVEELNSRSQLPGFERTISGDDQLVVYDIENKMKEQPKTGRTMESLKAADRRYRRYDAIMKSTLPITQGFYTLGIEKIREGIAPLFAFGRPEMQSLTDKLWKYMRNSRIYRAEDRRKIVSKMYRDWIVYRLSKTEMFGDTKDMSFDEKRQYYLYDYPAKFLKTKSTRPEVNEIDAIRRMFVNKGQIMLDRQGQTTTTLRDFITDSFDRLQQSDDPEMQQVANDLMMYSYYLNGYEFSFMSFGNMFSTEFQRAYSEYVQALRDMNTEDILAEDLDNFFEQFILKRGNMGLIPSMNFKKKSYALQTEVYDTGKAVSEWGGIDDVPEYVFGSIARGFGISNTLLRLSKDFTERYGTVIYLPIKTNTSLHYNANQTVDEMMEVVYDQDKINENYRLGNKKKSSEVIEYDRHQSTKDWKDKPESKDSNVYEPENESQAVNRVARENAEEFTADANTISRASGMTTEVDVDTRLDSYDAPAGIINGLREKEEKKEDTDPDISAGQMVIQQDNDGKTLCAAAIGQIE